MLHERVTEDVLLLCEFMRKWLALHHGWHQLRTGLAKLRTFNITPVISGLCAHERWLVKGWHYRLSATELNSSLVTTDTEYNWYWITYNGYNGWCCCLLLFVHICSIFFGFRSDVAATCQEDAASDVASPRPGTVAGGSPTVHRLASAAGCQTCI